MKIQLIILVIFIFFGNLSIAQKSKGGYPKTLNTKHYEYFHNEKDKHKHSFHIEFNAENERLKEKEKDRECKNCKLPYYGKEIAVNIDFFKTASKKKLKTGGELWLFKIKSRDSKGYQFIFNNFYLPEGGELIFYDKDQENFLGKFTNENNRDDNIFVTQPIFGNEVYIEYYQPSNISLDNKFFIEKVVCIFDDSFMRKGPFAYEYNEDCHINTACSGGWENDVESVALILEKDENNDYWGTCTGALINKVGNYSDADKPYFLSANHCYDLDGSYANVSNWVFLFRHETFSCWGDGSSINNDITKSVVGATVVSRDENKDKSDYLLLRLNDDVGTISNYDISFAGWTRHEIDAYSFESVCIHHPKGDVKKISTSNTSVVSSGDSGGNNANKYWKVIWTSGVTAKGSSGSPLFNAFHQIIGQLEGGRSYCEDYYEDGVLAGGPDWPDFFGKFSESWTAGNFSNYLGNAYTCSSYSPDVPDLQLSITPNPSIIVPGTNVTFTATSENANGNLTCWWIINTEEGDLNMLCDSNIDSDCNSSNTNPTNSFYFGDAGSYRITCYAMDNSGRTTTKDYILNVGDNLDPCIQVNIRLNTECEEQFIYPLSGELQIWDYAFAEFCTLWPGGPLKYDGIREIRWYVDNNLHQSFMFNKTDYCFAGDNCYWSGQGRGCFDLNSIGIGEHTIRMEAYAGILENGIFDYADNYPKSTISTTINVVDPNSSLTITNQTSFDSYNGYILNGTVNLNPTSQIIVSAGERLNLNVFNEANLKPGFKMATGSICRIVPLESDLSGFTCTPIVKSAQKELTSVTNLDTVDVNIYPNPVNDYAIVDLGTNYENVRKIEIFNAFGKLLYNQDCDFDRVNSIYTGDLNSGMYFVRVSFWSNQIIKKLVKND